MYIQGAYKMEKTTLTKNNQHTSSSKQVPVFTEVTFFRFFSSSAASSSSDWLTRNQY